jgi:hypothetical protein
MKLTKYSKDKLCTNLVLFTRLCRYARSTEHKIYEITVLLLRKLKFPGIRTCETTDELRLVIMSCTLKMHPP